MILPDCKHMERQEISEGKSDPFDDSAYKFFCHRSGEGVELLSPYCVEACKHYVPAEIK